MGDRIEPFSAGTAPGRLDPRAIQVMREAGVDITSQRSKHLQELTGNPFDWVITVCDRANESCPVFPGAVRRMHVGFDDPPRLAARLPVDEALTPYRRVRDEVRAFVERLPALLEAADHAPEPAEDRDVEGVLRLLRSADLPMTGVADRFPAAYSVIRSEAEVIAVAGLESHGRLGLLRSVVVASPYRELGLGRRLVDDRVDFASKQHLAAIYLLTTTAAPFFRALGFEDIDRSNVPVDLQTSSEFSSVCPTTALCLVKRLSRSD
jgi:arsenate reductase